jgi:hypothetical protein
MAFGCVDLGPGADVAGFVAALDQAIADARDNDEPLSIHIGEHDGRPRLSLHAHHGDSWLGPVLARAAAATGAVERAVLGLDHDQYGIEHVVLDGRHGRLARVQHVYIHPDGEPAAEYELNFTELPVRDGLSAEPDGTLDGPRSWAVVADLYDVPPERVVAAARQQATAHEELGVVFTPFAPWWDSLGLTYPTELGPPDVTLPRPGAP